MCKTHVFQRLVPKLKEKKLTSKTLNRFFKEDKERTRTHHQGLESDSHTEDTPHAH